MASMIHPNRLLIQTIHSPERGSLFRFPANKDRMNRGSPRPMLSVKKTRNAYKGSPF